MAKALNLDLWTPKWISLRRSEENAAIKQDASNIQNSLLEENASNWQRVIDRYNSFMNERADIRNSLRKWKIDTKDTNTNDAAAQMSLVFDFIRDVGASVYWNPDKVQATQDPEIAKIVWLTWDNISYDNISAFNDFINNPKWWDLTWTVYKLISWDKRMKAYMDAKYFWEEALQSGEEADMTLWSRMDKFGRDIENVPVVWDILWLTKNTIWWIIDSAVGTMASIADAALWVWEKEIGALLDTFWGEWLYNLDVAAWYDWTYDEWKEAAKAWLSNLDFSEKRKDFKWKIPPSFYDENEVSSQIWKTIEQIWEMLLMSWEKKLVEYASKPWVIGKISNALLKFKNAWATDSQAKWYVKWLSRIVEWWTQWIEAQWLSDLAEWELSSREQYAMAWGIGSVANRLLWWWKSLYNEATWPSKSTQTSLKRLNVNDINKIWQQADSYHLDKTLKTPTQNLAPEVDDVIKNQIKPKLDEVWGQIDWIENSLVNNTSIWAKDAIEKLNKTLADKWVNIRFEPVEIDWKIVYRTSWWGTITPIWDKYIETQTNPVINWIAEWINTITPAEFNTAKWYARVIKAIKRSSDLYKKEWWEIVGKIWSNAQEFNAPLEAVMSPEDWKLYNDLNDLYSKNAVLQKDLSNIRDTFSAWKKWDFSHIKTLEWDAEALWYDIKWLSDKAVVADASERFYKVQEWRDPSLPRPSESGATKWSAERMFSAAKKKPTSRKKYSPTYTPTVWENIEAEVGKKIPWQVWKWVSEFTYE